MDPALRSNLQNFDELAFSYYHLTLNEKLQNDKDNLEIIPLADLFDLVHGNMMKLASTQKLTSFLPILHNTILLTDEEVAGKQASAFFESAFDECKGDESNLLILLQLLYQILKSLPAFNADLERTSNILCEMMLQPDSNPVQVRSMICLKIVFEKFQSRCSLEAIWEKTKGREDILPHFIEYFLKTLNIFSQVDFWELNVQLLSSNSRNKRKCGIYLIQRTLEYLSGSNLDVNVHSYFKWNSENCSTIKSNWLQYLTILENLEEKQSHLILPSLEMLPRVQVAAIWMNTLLKQMLQHGNVLVLRWSVDFVLNRYTSATLDANILNTFILSFNNTFLFSEFSEQFDLQRVRDFVKGDIRKMLTCCLNADWKPVPMHVLFKSMDNIQLDTNNENSNKKLLLDIAAKIRQLQNRSIRADIRRRFMDLFSEHINQFRFTDYLRLLEASLNSNERIPDLKEFYHHIANDTNVQITMNLFKILSNSKLDNKIESALLDVFSNIPVEAHSWFKILSAFHFERTEKLKHFLKDTYFLNIDEIVRKMEHANINDTLQFLQSEFSKLAGDRSEQPVVMENVVDWYCRNYLQPEIGLLAIDVLIDAGGRDTTKIIAQFVGGSCAEIGLNCLDRIFTELKGLIKRFGAETPYCVAGNIVRHCIRRENNDMLEEYVNKILNIDSSNITLAEKVFEPLLESKEFFNTQAGIDILTKGLLYGEPLYGDEKTEFDYALREHLELLSTSKIRNLCLNFMASAAPSELRNHILSLSIELSRKKPRYFENSKQHRLKLRIAQVLARIECNSSTSTWNEHYLNAILNESNQTNVTYIHERIIANSITKERLAQLLHEISNYSNSSQVSIFAVAFLSCRIQNDPDFAESCIRRIIPWTMGQNYSTRLYAQISAYHLIKHFQLKTWDPILESITESFEKQLDPVQNFQKLNEDVRFNLCEKESLLSAQTIEAILYITKVPADEFETILHDEKIIAMRNAFSGANKKATNASAPSEIIEDVQRKMNPVKDLVDYTLVSYDADYNSKKMHSNEMIVVASLIDKLPNLGGIARTCEVLGIKNLVLGSLKQAEQKEFKNLSMTAENWLNLTELKAHCIVDFLMQKKTEGFYVVGAEQTANSSNFVNFKFPSKCVLLLGHEKEGIPANLISLLDFAVEIPQFGMVRSLNVHVTGALFMWEYCKQYLVKRQ